MATLLAAAQAGAHAGLSGGNTVCNTAAGRCAIRQEPLLCARAGADHNGCRGDAVAVEEHHVGLRLPLAREVPLPEGRWAQG